jgi:hypothetical protein
MFKRAQTFLFVLRHSLTKALHNGGHCRHRAAAAIAAAVAALRRLRLMLGFALLHPRHQSVAAAVVVAVGEATVSSTK